MTFTMCGTLSVTKMPFFKWFSHQGIQPLIMRLGKTVVAAWEILESRVRSWAGCWQGVSLHFVTMGMTPMTSWARLSRRALESVCLVSTRGCPVRGVLMVSVFASQT